MISEMLFQPISWLVLRKSQLKPGEKTTIIYNEPKLTQN